MTPLERSDLLYPLEYKEPGMERTLREEHGTVTGSQSSTVATQVHGSGERELQLTVGS